MGRHKTNEKRQEQFTKWIRAHHTLPAWKALSFPARDAYFHLRVRCFADTAQMRSIVRNNNGQIYRAARDLADDMGCSPKTAMAALADLQAKGWIVATELGCLGVEGMGKAPKFRLTMLDMGSGNSRVSATKEPTLWQEGRDYEILVYKTYLP
jgi:hypothetical protein